MGSYGTLWQARLDMMRAGNGAMAAVGVVVGGLILAPSLDGLVIMIPAAIAAFMITCFGNVLNDIMDRDLDAKTHPNRPLPSGRIDLASAKGFAGLLLAIGLFEAYAAAGTRTLGFAAVNVAVLWFYERNLKRIGLPGNVAIGALVASAFIFGAITITADWRVWGPVGALAVMAFLVNVARELLKDLEDMPGDTGSRGTFPMAAGPANTLALCSFLVAMAIALSAVTWYMMPWHLWWGLLLLIAAASFVRALLVARTDAGRGQRMLKLAMLIALAAFLVGATT